MIYCSCMVAAKSSGPLSLVAKKGAPPRIGKQSVTSLTMCLGFTSIAWRLIRGQAKPSKSDLELLDHIVGDLQHRQPITVRASTVLSMGGYGSWRFSGDRSAQRCSAYRAGLCVAAILDDRRSWKDLPIWFSSRPIKIEARSPFQRSVEMFEANSKGGLPPKIKFTSMGAHRSLCWVRDLRHTPTSRRGSAKQNASQV